VELLTALVHTAWDNKKIATMLSLDLSGAFDRVVPERLQHVLRMRRIPEWFTRWIDNFMSERTTTLIVDGVESPSFPIIRGVPQGSPLSPVIFVFYIADLLEESDSPVNMVTPIGFADDVQLLAFGDSAAENCRKLGRVHDRCIAWAKRTGMQPSPQKYELIHFSKRRTIAGETQASLTLPGITIQPKDEVRVLGIWLDPKLRWGAHIRKTITKADHQLRGLQAVAASTWGATFSRARQVYTAVVRSSLTHGAGVWHAPTQGDRTSSKGVETPLDKYQNKGLRVVAGAFRATPVRALETETYIPPLNIYLDSRLATFRTRLKDTGLERIIEKQCEKLRQRLQRRRHTRQAPQRGPTRDQWAKSWLEATAPPERTAITPKTACLWHWKTRWEKQIRGRNAHAEPPSQKIINRHKELYKAESAMMIQVRTGKIGLAKFLCNMKAPDFPTPICRKCGQGEETAIHLLFYCESLRRERNQLRNEGRLNIRKLMTTKIGFEKVSKWMIQHAGIDQFRLAGSLLYGEAE